MNIVVKEYEGTQIYRYELGEIKEVMVRQNKEKTHTLFEGNMDLPILKENESLYLHELNKKVIINEVIRSTDNKYIYITSYPIININKNCIPEELKNKKALFDEKYHKYEDKYLTDFIEKIDERVEVPRNIDFETIEKYAKFGVYVNRGRFLTYEKHELPKIFYTVEHRHEDRWGLYDKLNRFKKDGEINFDSSYTARSFKLILDNLGIGYIEKNENFKRR